MRILLLGDASNFHRTLAGALRKLGNEVIVASNGSKWMNTQRDIDLIRKPGKWGSIKYLASVLYSLQKMRGYDIVQVHSPIFVDLRPQKVSLIFDYLKRHNGKVVYEALGTDSNYVKDCLECKKFRYSDFRIGMQPSPHAIINPNEEKEWLANDLANYTDYFIDKVDGVIACLYEYFETYNNRINSRKLSYGGIPIDIDSIKTSPIVAEPEKVKFFIGVQKDRSALKGTDKMLLALKHVHDKYPDYCEMIIVENLPYERYVEEMLSSHVILDQLYSYTPATNALIAMARGLVAVSGAEPEYYDFINEKENFPIINVSPLVEGDIENKLEWIILNKSKLPELSKAGMNFVRKHNDSLVVAQRHLDFWNKLYN